MTAIHPFRIDVADEVLDRIRVRVAEYPWHEMPDDGGWAYGTNLDYMKELCAYWLDEYDWRKHEAEINRFSHYTACVDGIDLHFIHEKGSGPEPLPLIISHGSVQLSNSSTSSSRWPIRNASAAVRRMPSMSSRRHYPGSASPAAHRARSDRARWPFCLTH